MLCPCGKPVLQVGTPPVLLDPEPDPLGIYGRDGTDALVLFKVVE